MEKFVYLESAPGSGRFDLRGCVGDDWDRSAFEGDLARAGHGARRVMVSAADCGARDVAEADLAGDGAADGGRKKPSKPSRPEGSIDV